MLQELRALLKRRLPFYMVPTYIEFMTGFPTAAIGTQFTHSTSFTSTNVPILTRQKLEAGTTVDKKALPSLASVYLFY
jgi:hypothetical protein